LLNKAIEKVQQHVYNLAAQQGKGADSCPKITELQKDYTTNKH